MSKKSLFVGLLFAAVLTGANATAAFAGEVKGPSGTTPPVRTAGPANANSICVFSGLNDDPTAPLDGSGPNGPYGQDNKLGLADPRVFNPGDACRGGSNFARQK